MQNPLLLHVRFFRTVIFGQATRALGKKGEKIHGNDPRLPLSSTTIVYRRLSGRLHGFFSAGQHLKNKSRESEHKEGITTTLLCARDEAAFISIKGTSDISIRNLERTI